MPSGHNLDTSSAAFRIDALDATSISTTVTFLSEESSVAEAGLRAVPITRPCCESCLASSRPMPRLAP